MAPRTCGECQPPTTPEGEVASLVAWLRGLSETPQSTLTMLQHRDLALCFAHTPNPSAPGLSDSAWKGPLTVSSSVLLHRNFSNLPSFVSWNMESSPTWPSTSGLLHSNRISPPQPGLPSKTKENMNISCVKPLGATPEVPKIKTTSFIWLPEPPMSWGCPAFWGGVWALFLSLRCLKKVVSNKNRWKQQISWVKHTANVCVT